MTDPLVHHAVADGVAWITLDRPDKLNALTTAMLETLLATLTAVAAADEVRAVRLTGRGRGFCVGQDLSDRNVAADAAPPDLGASLEERYNPIVRAMRTLPKPVVVAVNGVAAGAGANLALAGDVVVAARSATFIESFARVGLVPDAGGTYFLPRLVGTARAAGLALLGEPLPAARAAEWGLIWEVVEDDRLETHTAELARRLAAGPTAGFAATKAALAASAGNDLDAQLDLERDLQRACGHTADYREGVRAFFERRDPEFTGR